MSFFDEIPDVFLSKLRYLCNQSKLKVLSPDINNDLFYLLVTFAFTGTTTTLELLQKQEITFALTSEAEVADLCSQANN